MSPMGDGEVNILGEIRKCGDDNRAQIENGTESANRKGVEDNADNFELMKYMHSARVYLSDRGVWFSSQNDDFPFEVIKMFICARNLG